MVPYQSLASLPALILSSVLHDLFMGISTGFFFPVFILLFATIGGMKCIAIIHYHCGAMVTTVGIVMLSGVRFSKTTTFLFTGIGVFLIESFYYTEVAARFYCPKEIMGHLEFLTFDCYLQYNNYNRTVVHYFCCVVRACVKRGRKEMEVGEGVFLTTSRFKVDLHCHILPKRWPDLKEVRRQ